MCANGSTLSGFVSRLISPLWSHAARKKSGRSSAMNTGARCFHELAGRNLPSITRLRIKRRICRLPKFGAVSGPTTAPIDYCGPLRKSGGYEPSRTTAVRVQKNIVTRTSCSATSLSWNTTFENPSSRWFTVRGAPYPGRGERPPSPRFSKSAWVSDREQAYQVKRECRCQGARASWTA